jgi:hypothetical protein
VRDEVSQLTRSVNRAQRAWDEAKDAKANQDIFIDSTALSLHGFYAGLKRLLEYTAHQLDGGPPSGPARHKELLRQMSMDLPGIRPSVLSAATIAELDEFRRFRHVVRNVYAEHLDPIRVGQLVTQLTAVWPQTRTDLETFTAFLEGVSQADDIL